MAHFLILIASLLAQPATAAYFPNVSGSSVVVRELGAGVELDIAASARPGYSQIRKFGNNQACSTTEEDVWAQGGQYNVMIATSVMQIRSGGNAADTAAGTGAQSIMIEGLDINFNFKSELLATNGASASLVSTNAFIRVNRAYVVDVGTYSSITASMANVGEIVVISTGTGNIVVSILATKGQSQLGHYTIPAGKTGYMTSARFSASATISTTISLYQRRNADDFTTPFSSRRLVFQNDEARGIAIKNFTTPILFTAKTDIWFTCLAVSGTPAASAAFDITLIDN